MVFLIFAGNEASFYTISKKSNLSRFTPFVFIIFREGREVESSNIVFRTFLVWMHDLTTLAKFSNLSRFTPFLIILGEGDEVQSSNIVF